MGLVNLYGRNPSLVVSVLSSVGDFGMIHEGIWVTKLDPLSDRPHDEIHGEK